ncbi:Type II secretory pathway, component ExeA (predicted ATPase) [endosymbiont of Ridgeia piscesae]|jgi:type II secretory pathway predicted ATPase ExeA|uniref:Type II secretory pathway, component ExeA (Predicted ATPase) n=3 Tax=endosymbiont of Ridgeia piscesae TaxID=54398 RepID=A0A0T5YX95_9GAMM|nr:AAA family ATPase [endosymbiont of Ridgeia piscesae]KRT55135.1 Type II secretory pathway, component ExeA (predicted ATPase) [endosymbiont of Ridgeia piscesae]
MYLKQFGLTRKPFAITPDTRRFFSGASRGAVLDALLYAITNGEGIVKLVGEVGSGKTMLSRMLGERLPASVDLVYIANPSLTADDILRAIAIELGFDIAQDARRFEVMQQLQSRLIQHHAEQRQVVVFIDEAQAMPLQTLEQIRLLSNLETRDHKLLQMVLFGQPELDRKLADPEIRQLRERITYSLELPPLSSGDVHAYLNFRLQQSGYQGVELFSRSLARRVRRYSQGLIRRINIIADKSLLAAYSEGSSQLRRRHIRLAAQESGLLHSTPRWLYAAASLLLGLTGLTLSQAERVPHPAAQPPSPIVAATPSEQSVSVAPEPAGTTLTEAALPATSKRSGDSDELINRRLRATRQLLTDDSAGGYSIQLLTTQQKPVYLKNFFAKHGEQLDPEQVFIYPLHSKGSDYFIVLYGHYADPKLADSALNALPTALTEGRPYIRSLRRMRDEAQPWQG